MINGVIFDMDGLMFDTERMWATFWEPALAALGLEYKEGLAEAERGTAGETSRNIVRQFYGEDCDANAIIDSLHRVADEEFQKPVPKKPGLDELLAWLDANHIPMAVASSSRVHVIEGNLNNWGLTHYFKALVSGQQVKHSKPDPEIFLLAAEKLWYGHGLEKTRLLKHLYMLPLLAVSFVLFHAADLPAAGQQIAALFGFGGLPASGVESLYYLRSYAVVLVIALLGATPLPAKAVQCLRDTSAGSAVLSVAEPVALVLLLAACTAYLVDGSFNPFLYFRF